jgi:hypothetical protein
LLFGKSFAFLICRVAHCLHKLAKRGRYRQLDNNPYHKGYH